jgi:phage terminase large subunit GpA-like protein
LCCFVLPILYHLFEIGETVVVGLPDGDMAADKWERDLWPAIQQTRYAHLFPSRGRGSRGGKFDTIHFLNGATLKFMTGGGGDKSRAHFTTRVVCFTEVDGLDSSHSTSVEAAKVKQIEARTLSYGENRRIYKECTVSVDTGHIWSRYKAGTESRIVIRCPHCRLYVTPERENLTGWQDATNELAAAQQASFVCPSCEKPWSEDDRSRANADCKLIHRGQGMTKSGKVTGDGPEVKTLGFRWSAANNLFLSTGFLGASEWHASRSISEDDAQRQMSQFYWAIPYTSPDLQATRLDFDKTKKKQAKWSKGLIPENTAYVTVGVDIGKRLMHWVATAWLEHDQGAHTFDYGREEVPSDDMAVERAILLALRSMRERCEDGWVTPAGKQRPPDQVWIDAGWMPDAVYDFCRESNRDFYRPIIGRGIAQDRKRWYSKPKRTGATVKKVGNGWHVAYVPATKMHLVEINADIWKSRIHQMLLLSPETKGSLTLYRATENEHVSFVKHMMAEHEVDEFIAGRGVVKRWEKQHSNNHWFDAQYIAAAAASFCGFGLFDHTDLRQASQGGGGLGIRKLQRVGDG